MLTLILKSSKYSFIPLIIAACFLSGCSTSYRQGVTPEGKKVYLGPETIELTPAFRNYLLSSKSESSKLHYLLDRIKDSREVTYLFEGNEHRWFEAYGAGVWILWHHYKKGEDARSFLRKEVSMHPDPNQTPYIQQPDGSSHMAYHVLLNELDLLDETYRQYVESNEVSNAK